MLAEIFMIRLETTKQESRELSPAGTPQFVPFSPAASFEFKKQRARK